MDDIQNTLEAMGAIGQREYESNICISHTDKKVDVEYARQLVRKQVRDKIVVDILDSCVKLAFRPETPLNIETVDQLLYDPRFRRAEVFLVAEHKAGKYNRSSDDLFHVVDRDFGLYTTCYPIGLFMVMYRGWLNSNFHETMVENTSWSGKSYSAQVTAKGSFAVDGRLITYLA